MVIEGLEHGTLLRRSRKGHHSLGRLIDGRHLGELVVTVVGTAAQHVEHLEATHIAVAVEVGLELAVVAARCQIAYTHHLGIQSVMGNGIENQTFGQELRADVTVVEELSEPQLALIQHGHLFAVVMDNPYLAYGGSGDMYQSCAGIQTEVYAALCTTDVHILDIGTLGEVLHIGSAVEYSVDVAVHIDFLCHVAIHHKETGAEEFFK